MSSAATKISETYSGLQVRNFAQENDSNFSAPRGNNISTESVKDLPCFTITQHELTEKVQAVMLADVGNDPGAAKRLARKLGCSVATAKNYLEGRTTPIGIPDARAMAVIPGYLKMKMDLAGLKMALDPRHQAKMAEFMRYCQIEADKIFGGAI